MRVSLPAHASLFPQKNATISVSFAENDLQLKTSPTTASPQASLVSHPRESLSAKKKNTIRSSLAENDLQLKTSCGSSPPCTTRVSFHQKKLIVSGSFAENDLQLETSCGSSPPCLMRFSSLKRIQGLVFRPSRGDGMWRETRVYDFTHEYSHGATRWGGEGRYPAPALRFQLSQSISLAVS